MLKFEKYLIEAKNTHLEHIEDLIFNEGVVGTRKAIFFLRDLRDMLAGHSNSKKDVTVKWDGAPAIFAGVDPEDGKFFVAKKGLFNKTPKMYKTNADIDAELSGDLNAKFKVALENFSKLGLTKGVYQGDLMFTTGDVKTETIDGDKYYTFQPNTIVYAVPVKSELGRKINSAQIGVVWHTTYTGNAIADMKASFGKDIASKMNDVSSVWQTDATYRDLTGNAVFTDTETQKLDLILSNIGKVFRKVPAGLLNTISSNEELKMRIKTYNNTFVRAGKGFNLRTHTKGLMNYIHDFYQKEIDSKKSQDSKNKWTEKRKDLMSVFSKYTKKNFDDMFQMMNLMISAKEAIINKMNHASQIGTFLRTRNGFKVTDQEGFVAIDQLSNDAIKIVNRLEFSRANFSSDVIKGWEK